MSPPDAGATPQGTSEYFEKYALPGSPITLGRTGLKVSPVGFGCYRIGDEEPDHYEALSQALLSGCNLIDTSTNYGDGASERVVGAVLAEQLGKGAIRRDQVVIVSKVGYVQGENLSLAKDRQAQGKPFPEMVEYTQACWHCISPEFLEDQLTRSLERLRLSRLDVLLLHNPEYFLSTQDDHTEYYRRIQAAFAWLEVEVKRGRIRYYGISSNTFPAPRQATDYTSLETVLEQAKTLGPENHFAVIQFPLNLFEPGAVLEDNNTGRSVERLARDSGLGVLTNRPLNAFADHKLIRLADFPAHDGEDIVGNLKGPWGRAMELEMDYPKLVKGEKPPMSWGHTLKQNFGRFSELDSWRQALRYQIMPSFQDTLDSMSEDTRVTSWLEEYRAVVMELFDGFTAYLESQAAHESERITSLLVHAVPELQSSPTLSQKAIRIYRSFPGIHCVLLGMRKPEYVRDGMAMQPPLTEEQARKAIEAVAASAPMTH